MLILKAFVNNKQIDELHIHNTGKTINNVTEYKIKKPEGYDMLQIFHVSSNGWKVLTEKVLYAINSTDSIRGNLK